MYFWWHFVSCRISLHHSRQKILDKSCLEKLRIHKSALALSCKQKLVLRSGSGVYCRYLRHCARVETFKDFWTEKYQIFMKKLNLLLKYRWLKKVNRFSCNHQLKIESLFDATVHKVLYIHFSRLFFAISCSSWNGKHKHERERAFFQLKIWQHCVKSEIASAKIWKFSPIKTMISRYLLRFFSLW